MSDELKQITKLQKEKLHLRKRLSYTRQGTQEHNQLVCEYICKVCDLHELIIHAVMVFSQLTDRQHECMFLRYVEGRTWKDIAVRMGFKNTGSIMKLHQRAVSKYKIIKKDEVITNDRNVNKGTCGR